MTQNICRLCYRPILRGVNLSNGTIIHERCLIATQEKVANLSTKKDECENAVRTLKKEQLRQKTFTAK